MLETKNNIGLEIIYVYMYSFLTELRNVHKILPIPLDLNTDLHVLLNVQDKHDCIRTPKLIIIQS